MGIIIDFKWLEDNINAFIRLSKNHPHILIIFLLIIALFVGRVSKSLCPDIKTLCQKVSIVAEEPKTVLPQSKDTKELLPLTNFEKNLWDLGNLELQKDGFYCPPNKASFQYYYAWYKSSIPLLSINLFKVTTRSRDLKLSSQPGDFVVKLGKEIEYSELYLPARNRETAPYKQNLNNKLEFFKPGLAITTPVKPGTPIEILSIVQVAEGNRVKPEYSITYISKTANSTRMTDPLLYPPFTVDETRVEDESIKVGLGVDKDTCLKIEGYNINISKEMAKQIKEQR